MKNKVINIIYGKRGFGITFKNNLDLLNEYKEILTKQQYKTLKGQLLQGDEVGFRKGLFKLAKIRYIGCVK